MISIGSCENRSRGQVLEREASVVPTVTVVEKAAAQPAARQE